MGKYNKEIMARLKALGATRHKLAKISGVDRDTVYDICSGTRDPYLSTVDKIEAALAKMEKEAHEAPAHL